ncbi:hypothetical protein [Ruminococcus sp. 5_1_39BFAA]|uniref:hypothetical protein n=1 Tax=Ruminococcus sp. 5_1_39BFAA TaxID=457412 RepID=UPI0035614196
MRRAVWKQIVKYITVSGIGLTLCAGLISGMEAKTVTAEELSGYGVHGDFDIGASKAAAGVGDMIGEESSSLENKMWEMDGGNSFAGFTAGGIGNSQVSQPDTMESTSKVSGFKITEVQDKETGMTVARCYAPSDYTINEETIWCGKWQSAGVPAQVYLTALSPDGNTVMGFYSQVGYEHLLESSISGSVYKQHQDGVFDTEYMTPMLQFMTADAYCDYLAQSILPNQQLQFMSQEEVTAEHQNRMDALAYELYQQMGQLVSGTGISVDDAYFGSTERVYSVTLNGFPFLLTVSVATQGVQMSAYMDFGYNVTVKQSFISWESPCAFFILTPADEYDGNYANYEQFVLNTTVSDQFTAALIQTRDKILQTMTQSGCTSMNDVSDYCQSSVSSSAGPDTSYSDERFTDYIFSQNDYTLSNDDHVKIPTSYDYVYADDNGNVYVTNSTDQPAGTTQLYPN